MISAAKLKALAYDDPIKRNAGLDIYEEPKEDHTYVVTVDVARGVDKDYSAFCVCDTTTFPYRLVA